MATSTSIRIDVTQQAHGELVKAGATNGTLLRLGVRPGGCAGFQYEAVLANRRAPSDTIVYDREGVTIAADARHAEYLDGVKLDYSSDLVRPGFVLTNSRVQGSCGCGSSFGGRKGGCC